MSRFAPQVRAVKRAVRRIYPVHVEHAEWPALLAQDFPEFQRRLASLPADAPRVLLVPSTGHPTFTTLDSLLTVALTLRGANVDVLLCDEALPACHNCLLGKLQDEWVTNEFLRFGPKRDICRTCYSPAAAMFRTLGANVLQYSDFLEPSEIESAWRLARTLTPEQICEYTVDGVPIGEHTRAGAIRFFARTSLEREPHGIDVLRRYFAAALITHAAIDRLLSRNQYVSATFNHGIYIPQGVVSAVARRHGVRVAAWAVAYRKRSFIFSHDDTYHHALMDEPVSTWENMPWDEEVESDLLDYLKSRWTGAEDWITFSRAPETALDVISRETGIDFSKPSIGLLTNVMWDAQLHYPQNAFRDMWDWLVTTIRYFEKRPELQLIIRVHPAELRGHIESRQPIAEEIRRELGALPPNIYVIPPDSKVSTYAVMTQCDSVLIYGTKTGVELTSLGVPVIVAGEAWIRNKGITIDARSREHYLQLLESLPLRRRMDDASMLRAKKYAYHFFFRRMIPVGAVVPLEGKTWSPYAVRPVRLAEIERGGDPGLDAICDGILTGREFIYQAEEHRQDGGRRGSRHHGGREGHGEPEYKDPSASSVSSVVASSVSSAETR
jgi:capsular polysaccharide biosynthesis protein